MSDVRRYGMTAFFDGMSWPVTGLDLNNLEWRLRYAADGVALVDTPATRDRLTAASVVAAYRALLLLPRRELNKRVTQLRAAARLPDTSPRPTPEGKKR